MNRAAWVRHYNTGGEAPPSVSGIDPPFWPKLVEAARAVGADPRDWAAVMLLESGLSPSAANRNASGSAVAVGLNQLSTVGTDGRVGSAGNTFAGVVPLLTPAEYLKLPASRQFDFVNKFFSAQYRRFPELAAEGAVGLQWVNFLPATFVPGAPDDHVIPASPSSIAGNQGFVFPGEHVIRKAGLRKGLEDAQEGKAARWAAIVANIDAAEAEGPALVSFEGGASPTPAPSMAPIVGAFALGFAIVAVRRSLRRA